ncbi:MAG: tetratricopeptide repeat protein [Myxococcota bacterium]
MRMLIPAASLVLLVACGKKETPPAPDAATAATSAPPPTKAPEPAPSPDAAPSEPTPAVPAADAAPSEPAPVPDAAPTAEVAGDDLLVWTDTAAGRETVWLHGDEVVATRPEAVTLADGKLWALGERWRTVTLRPCDPETMEADPKAKTTAAIVPRLVAKELGGAGEVVGKDPAGSDGDSFDGELEASVGLDGGIGAVVFASGGTSYYGCGAAHPDADSDVGAFDLVKSQKVEVPSDDALKTKLGDALLADAKKNECLEEGETIGATAPENVRLSFGDGRGMASVVASRGDLGHARAACENEVLLEVPLDATLGFGPIDARVAKVVAARPGTGAFGLATVPADQRAALLERFKSEPASFQPKPEAAPVAADDETVTSLLAKGRKLTSAKDYAGAIAAFDAAVAKDAGAAAAWSGRGYAKLLAKDAGAKADLEKALELEKSDTRFQAAVWFNLGQLAERDKDLAAAKSAYTKANELNPSDAAKHALERVSK